MSDGFERSTLERKDRAELSTIAEALGRKPPSRAKKAEIVDLILELSGVASAPASNGAAGNGAASNGAAGNDDAAEDGAATAIGGGTGQRDDGPDATAREAARDGVAGSSADDHVEMDAGARPDSADEHGADAGDGDSGGARQKNAGQSNRGDQQNKGAQQSRDGQQGAGQNERQQNKGGSGQGGQGQHGGGQGGGQAGGQSSGQGDDEQGNRRRRRRGRNRDRQGGEQIQSDDNQWDGEPVPVAGLLDLRDDGYGFLRVNGFLPSRNDVYVPVKFCRQIGLRKGDHLTGTARPAGRQEKNPAMLSVELVNGRSPEESAARPKFEDLTPLFPDQKLHLEDPSNPLNMTARIIDLISPIGKGQRGLIVSPPKAGKTTVMKTIAQSIERNNPDVHVIVLLIDERPEEVTDFRRSIQGSVVSSTFDRPSDEHTQVAELTIEHCKRMVEYGQDVVIILDGITRLSRAYNLAAPATGRIMSGGIDTGALYPPKKFFGAARNVEEGGSLTILATALVETGSTMDTVIFEEFKGTGNMELRLDRRASEKRVYPAIDVDASSTRHEELLFERTQLQQVWKLRRVLSGLAAEGNATASLELLIDRMKTFKSNDAFLAEIAKAPSMPS